MAYHPLYTLLNSSHVNVLFAGEEIGAERGGTFFPLPRSPLGSLGELTASLTKGWGPDPSAAFPTAGSPPLHSEFRVWQGMRNGRWRQLLLCHWVEEKTRLHVCLQCFFLPLTFAMMIGISLPQTLSDLASLFICRTLGGFWKQVWPGWAERSHNFFKKLLWLRRLLPTFQMSLSLSQGLFFKVAGKLVSYLFWLCIFRDAIPDTQKAYWSKTQF